MGSAVDITSSFIEGAPPSELADVVKDIKALTSDDDPTLTAKLKPAFQHYNEKQLTTVKLPGASEHVLISSYNKLPSSDRYYDTSSSTSFEFDHSTSKASAPQSYTHDTKHSNLISAIQKSLSAHFAEHYPPTSTSAYSVCATPDDAQIAVLMSSTKSSPKNFISGQWRSEFLYDPSSSSLSGNIKVNVHYYEDGNVALTTSKKIDAVDAGGDAASIVRKIAAVEKQYQEEVNRTIVGMNETSFKALRRQLPVTRQKVEWEKVRGYGLGSDLRGEAKR
ncbi:F-actin-capping protein subunit alpha [Elasticomyces elasticus]|uniref:F-actin-capping protein subunit alpha n=1 Tax=Exophiala sideris TaxID=1016849 RepID=A0ABR0JTD2_9EURO|nr:F-actin-capping protein subunit alpha [Elasticomyces elasticus]KAK5040306.1 F-actin-capping protein subunit alpha [Exophiala sideris]KAK5043268.1 F-actin-capping protein subunit alpha [Exophiala sideris]KAK5068684.1 F-actin-capping protein subunit alpha [Exophiala sideris]KAK5186282.1 F-actin-capping protein subunit alpha [Eurotiomycetes sp. CCFEE 6388]